MMLFLAAITSSISMLQPVIAFFEEGLGLKRHASVAFLGLITALGSGFVVYFSKDRCSPSTRSTSGAARCCSWSWPLIQAILYGWVLGIERGEQEAHEGAHLRIPRFVQFILKYVSPAFLMAVLVGSIITDGRPKLLESAHLQPSRSPAMSFGFIVLLLASSSPCSSTSPAGAGKPKALELQDHK